MRHPAPIRLSALLLAAAIPFAGCADAPQATDTVEGASNPLLLGLTLAVGTTVPTLPPGSPPALDRAATPPVPNLDRYVRDPQWAVMLGKALFWDQAVGSDGMACASCHFHAGADNRITNQLSASLAHTDPTRAGRFNATRTGTAAPNYRLRRGDFPFHVLADPNDRDSAVLFDSDDVASSAGVFRRAFQSPAPSSTAIDTCGAERDPIYNLAGNNTRGVEPRNSPTVINAVYYHRNFWDGRANNVFNGVSPFGARDTAARVYRWTGSALAAEPVRLENSSLASQAVGPVLSDLEMSCGGRSFASVATKLLDRRALADQQVALDDSVFATHVPLLGRGLNHTYRAMIQRAFQPEWWSAPAGTATPSGVSQIEQNFTLFFGLAVQAYEATLVSDDAPYDRYARGNGNALTDAQRRGLDVFTGRGRCVSCHSGAAFSNAAFAGLNAPEPIQRMRMGAGHVALYDEGFYNIGVRPTAEDVGLGGTDPWGHPLSFSRQWLTYLNTGAATPDRFAVDPSNFAEPVALPASPTLADLRGAFGADAVAVDGAFKTPTLRNIELTGPYFHNGGTSTLEDVVRFYNRGGDRRRVTGGDTTGFAGVPSNLDADIVPLGLSAQEQSDLVAFLRALTDERVRYERAPFDHPALALPEGHTTATHPQLGAGHAADRTSTLPAIGRGGRGLLQAPLQPFHTRLD